jgi:DNA polymerase-3 subunit alpha
MLDFHVSGNDITFGLLALKNVGRQFVDRIIYLRGEREYSSFGDFLERMSGSELNRRMVESLIKAGAFDSLGVYRSKLLATLENALLAIGRKSRGNIMGQLDMFSMAGEDMGMDDSIPYPDIPEFSIRDLLSMEREVAGLYFSGHLLDNYKMHIESISPVRIADIVGSEEGEDRDEDTGVPDGTPVTVCGMITAVVQKATRKGDVMAFATIEDKSGSGEIVVFSKQYASHRRLIVTDNAVCIHGSVSRRDGERAKILLNVARPLLCDEEYKRTRPAPESTQAERKTAPTEEVQKKAITKLYIRVPSKDSLIYQKCANIAEIFDGSTKLFFYYSDVGQYEEYAHGVEISKALLDELGEIAGNDSVVGR